jgi:hypothetical protein
MRRVAVLIPSQDMCHTGFAMSLAHMIERTCLNPPENLEGLVVNCFESSMLQFSRQTLAKNALEQDVTHMLWIDSDMSFPDDMLLSFLRRDEAIIGINAMNRRKPFRNTALVSAKEQCVTTKDSSGLEKVFRMGFGVVWISCEVFKQMTLPYFDFNWVPDESLWMGEDYSFFEKAKALGYELYVDHDISKRVNHIGMFSYNPLMMGVAEGLNQ